jgi:hypothetical protein
VIAYRRHRVALEVIIMHKRNSNKLQERKIRGIIFRGSFYDRQCSETISKITRAEALAQLNEPIEVNFVPDLEKGEVLLDSRGSGSLQHLAKLYK